MQMSNEEIARRYRQNKKKSQIETLAQLNDCPKSVIIEILRGKGLIDENEGEKNPKQYKVPNAVITACTERSDSIQKKKQEMMKQLNDLKDEEEQLVEFMQEMEKNGNRI